MFELPASTRYGHKATERKLRYRYLNYTRHKYAQMLDNEYGSCLPTPEASGNETSENEDGDNMNSKRVRRRWKKVLGEAISEDDASEAEGDDDNEGIELAVNDKGAEESHERAFFKNYEKPEKSFEKWGPSESRRAPIRTQFVNFKQVRAIRSYATKRMAGLLSHTSKSSRSAFQNRIDGFEVISCEELADGFLTRHIRLLTNLLYVNLARQKWAVAYKCFALLIRIPKVEIRRIWGVGSRILEALNTHRALDFLKWMSNMYSSRAKYIQGINHQIPPAFTSSSRNHTSIAVLSWLWLRLEKCTLNNETEIGIDLENLQEIIEKISEMVIVPPYMDEPAIWYIYAMCHFVKADYLSKMVLITTPNGSAKDIAHNEVIQNIQFGKSFLEKCRSFDRKFRIPRFFLNKQLERLETRLYKDNSEDEKQLMIDTERELDTQSIMNDSDFRSDAESSDF